MAFIHAVTRMMLVAILLRMNEGTIRGLIQENYIYRTTGRIMHVKTHRGQHKE